MVSVVRKNKFTQCNQKLFCLFLRDFLKINWCQIEAAWETSGKYLRASWILSNIPCYSRYFHSIVLLKKDSKQRMRFTLEPLSRLNLYWSQHPPCLLLINTVEKLILRRRGPVQYNTVAQHGHRSVRGTIYPLCPVHHLSLTLQWPLMHNTPEGEKSPNGMTLFIVAYNQADLNQ